MNMLLALVSAAFSLWVILAVRILVRFLFRAPVTRFDGRLLGAVTLLTVILAAIYWWWLSSLSGPRP